MTKEIFFAHKEGITEAMNSALIMSKHRGKALHKYCETYDNIIVTIKKECTEEEFGLAIEKIYKLSHDYGAPTIAFTTHTPHCIERTTGAMYSFKIPKLRDRIEESQVAQKMKTLIRKELGLKTYDNLECKVMQLFKDGHISWDEVQAQHGVACKL